jgi:hypothetical protein
VGADHFFSHFCELFAQERFTWVPITCSVTSVNFSPKSSSRGCRFVWKVRQWLSLPEAP